MIWFHNSLSGFLALLASIIGQVIWHFVFISLCVFLCEFGQTSFNIGLWPSGFLRIFRFYDRKKSSNCCCWWFQSISCFESGSVETRLANKSITFYPTPCACCLVGSEKNEMKWRDKRRDSGTLNLSFKTQNPFGNSDSLLFCSSRPGRPPKRGPVGLSLPASHMANHPQLKKHRLDNDYPYENGHMTGELRRCFVCFSFTLIAFSANFSNLFVPLISTRSTIKLRNLSICSSSLLNQKPVRQSRHSSLIFFGEEKYFILNRWVRLAALRLLQLLQQIIV